MSFITTMGSKCPMEYRSIVVALFAFLSLVNDFDLLAVLVAQSVFFHAPVSDLGVITYKWSIIDFPAFISTFLNTLNDQMIKGVILIVYTRKWNSLPLTEPLSDHVCIRVERADKMKIEDI